ncbi:hypothetical protein CEXT_604991 [Caerostris extrusa]|uniref:Uncharacterized protein n=1 Tax=Caerostris extrusa TaxID=172846 RepID=A0AAV4XB14_CAEEX|nr:hypothetical protein CEXT_604991 [Caerostris extrusa]
MNEKPSVMLTSPHISKCRQGEIRLLTRKSKCIRHKQSSRNDRHLHFPQSTYYNFLPSPSTHTYASPPTNQGASYIPYLSFNSGSQWRISTQPGKQAETPVERLELFSPSAVSELNLVS